MFLFFERVLIHKIISFLDDTIGFKKVLICRQDNVKDEPARETGPPE